MSSAHAGSPRKFLLGVLTTFVSIEISGALAQQARDALPPVEVSPPVDQARKPAKPAGRDGRGVRRAAPNRTAATVAQQKPGGLSAAQTPLNTNAVAESASRLGVTVREVPASVEVISAQTIREQGYRTVSEVVQGAVGLTSGDNPAEPRPPRCAASPTARSNTTAPTPTWNRLPSTDWESISPRDRMVRLQWGSTSSS
jgi:iron complex outermembrane recepter protein